MSDKPIHLLVVGNGCPLPASVVALLESGEFRATTVTQCSDVSDETLATGIDAAIIVDTRPEDPCRTDLPAQVCHLLGRLGSAGISVLVMTRDADGRADAAPEWVDMIRPDISRDELIGRFRTMARYRTVIRQLERDLSSMQRLGKKLNRHFTEIDQEMRLASRLQRDFLPKDLPTVGGIRFSTLFRPASWVSGDIYDVFRIDERHLGMYVADAVGHGMAAGLLTMFIKRSIVPKRIFTNRYELISPSEVLAVLNENLQSQNLPNCQFVTACYAIYNVATRELRVARGGHPYPIRIGTDGNLTEIRSGGGLLGVFTEEDFETVSTTLAPGEKLLLYSDGIEMAFLETRTVPGNEPRYKKEFRAAAHLPAEELVGYLAAAIDQQEGSLNPQDDVTVIVMETDRADSARQGSAGGGCCLLYTSPSPRDS